VAKLSVNQALSKAKSHEKKGEILEAQKLYKVVLDAFPNNKKAKLMLANLDRLFQNGNVKKLPSNIINQLVALYDQGHFLLVVEHCQKIVSQFPDAFIVWNILGGANKGLGRVEEASKAFMKVVKLNPTYAEGYNNLGVTLHEQGKFKDALLAYKKAISIKPRYAESYSNMGTIYKDQGQLEKASDLFKKAILINSNYAEAYSNLGNTFLEKGNLEAAIISYEKAISIEPNYAEANYNMGFALSSANKPKEAIDAYNKAISIKSNYPEAYSNLGNAYKEIGNIKEAINVYRKAISINPNYAQAYNNLGNVFQEQDKLELAMEAYKKAASLKLEYSEAWINGAEALEKWNKLDELDDWLKQAHKNFKIVPSDISYFQSKFLWRIKERKEALKLISTINFETVSENRKQGFLNLKAKCFESSQNFSKAYDCFLEMNLLAKKSDTYLNSNSDKFFANTKNQLEQLKLKVPSRATDSEENSVSISPIFLVGFPRSGTTLMDTILRSHSKIEVLEEKPTVVTAKAVLRKNGYNEIHNKVFSIDKLSEAKAAYIKEFRKHIKSSDTNSVYIDKLPLNLIETPLINQLFPSTKFILALRHPFDTILSCWMQDFEINAAMANMVDLDRIVDLYCIAMETFKICRSEYNLNVHTIRYEDLLDDLKGESSALLTFLDLTWETKMEDYRATALKRGRINTPSYSQVSQPIYKEARYRWVNYKEYLEKYSDQIEPWIQEFGYVKN
jgi:tetratricopeptide (TPR) repeat protein